MSFLVMWRLILITLVILLAVIAVLNLVPHGNKKLTAWADILQLVFTTILVISLAVTGLFLLGTLILM